MSRTSYDALSEEALLSLGSMEGVYELPVMEKRAPAPPKAAPADRILPGFVLAALVAAAGFAIHYLPFAPFRLDSPHGARRPISASIIAILVGLLARNLYAMPASILPGCKSIVRRVIPLCIVLTGAGLNLTLIAGVGLPSLAITVVCIALALATARYAGRLLGVWPKTALLIGAGTAICGTSAIVAVAPLIDAEDEDVTLSVGTVSLLGLILMFALPLVGGLLGMDEPAFGVWAGTSIHAVPQVVAAGFAFGEKAGALATLVKLMRVTLLAPFMFVLMLLYARRQAGVTVHYARFVPPFVWGFLAVAVLNTASLIPALEFARHRLTLPLGPVLSEGGNILLTLAMAALGLEVNVRRLAHVGGKALLTGVVSSVALCGASLALIRILL
ncbi:MAG: putative sulfate exporter family transporter [Acidobacteria bacterium]|nr:putative sulfate exporter family transporter [Acidobacteriota bacterium]